MSNLKEISTRINSVKSIQKTTKVMQMISASKFHRTQQNLLNSRAYISKLEDLLLKSGGLQNYKTTTNKPVLFIIISSDRGLCGGFNNVVVKCSKNHIDNLLANKKEVKLWFLGTKAYTMMKKFYHNHIIKVSEIKNISDALSFKFFIHTSGINFHDFSIIEICYNQFHSSISQSAHISSLPFLEKSATYDKGFTSSDYYHYEPTRDYVIMKLKRNYFFALLYGSFIESVTSEHCARMMAMESANNNTKDMLNELVLLYNRSRQSLITTDLIEVISGFEALSE